MRRKLGISCILLILVLAMLGHSCLAASYIIDNDDSTGYSNNSIGTWDLITHTGCYRGDARISQATQQNMYGWVMGTKGPLMGGECRAAVYVYLNYSSFTGMGDYTLWVMKGNEPIHYPAATLAQGGVKGWVRAGTVLWYIPTVHRVNHVTLTPRNEPGSFVGADGLRFDTTA